MSDSSARRLTGAQQKHGAASMYLVHEDRSHIDVIWADRAQLCVARTVALPFTGAIARFVGHETPGGLALDPYWKRDDVGPLGRCHLASARTRGTLQVGWRAIAVEVELTPWANRVTEVVLRPASRRAYRWSARRRQRWYPAAHTAIDALRHELLTTPQRPVTARPAPHHGRLAG
jgi:hypothetical protein